MTSFDEYVIGKTIAIVGPAPVPYDQSAEIDAHDLVYRTSWGYRSGYEGDLLEFDPTLFPTGTGTRCDMSFYNGQMSREAITGKLDPVYARLDWAIHKFAPDYVTPLCQVRVAHRAPRNLNGIMFQANQVPWMLYDLAHFEVAAVTVYGSNFYAGPVESWYDAGYEKRQDWYEDRTIRHDPTEAMGPGFHDQEGNRELVRRIRQDKGWPVGDARFLAALEVPRDVHEAALREQSTRFRKTAETV